VAQTSELTIRTETLPGSQVGLTIEVAAEEVDAAFERVIEKLSRKVKIQGFRPGKAPRAVILARLGGEAIREEAIEDLVPRVVSRAIAEKNVDAIDTPRVDILDFEQGKAARFKATVSVMPDVRLPDLGAIVIEKPGTKVTDEMVDQRLAELLETQATLVPVEREAREGDVVVADLEVSVDGREVANASRKAMEIEIKEGVLIPELHAAVPGKKVDEVAEVDVEMPEDSSDAELRGRLTHLRLTLRGIKEKDVPKLNDHVAETISNGEQKTALELKIAIRRDLEEQARRFDELALEQQVLKAIVDAAETEVPASLVDHEVSHQMQDMETRLQRQGLKLDRYFAYSGTTAQEWAAKARPDAEARLKVDLVLGEASKRLRVEPTTEEVYAYLMAEAAKDEELAGQVDQLTTNKSAVDYFRHRLTRLRTLAELVAITTGEKPAPAAAATVAGEGGPGNGEGRPSQDQGA